MSDQKAYTAGYDAGLFGHRAWSTIVASSDYPSALRYRRAYIQGFEDGQAYREDGQAS